MALVGVIPAAGSATRLQPLQSSKEVIPVRGRPVMDYLVERLRRADCDEIRLVTRPDKGDVAAHAEALGLSVLLATPATAAESVAFGVAGLDEDDVVLLGFPDTIWEPVGGFARLVNELDYGVDAVLGLFRTPDLERSDVVSLDPDGRVTAVAVKPARPTSEWIWGCAAVRAGALENLAAFGAVGYRFDELARRGVVRGLTLSDRWVDIGTAEGLQRTLANGEAPADQETQAFA